ncbi:MAG: hypothetical protein K9W44_17245 [Candidatus Lokiarchaeota archaeon]|nr:hypothetical protein [Candidatus Harpocratesius repetitus]
MCPHYSNYEEIIDSKSSFEKIFQTESEPDIILEFIAELFKILEFNNLYSETISIFNKFMNAFIKKELSEKLKKILNQDSNKKSLDQFSLEYINKKSLDQFSLEYMRVF